MITKQKLESIFSAKVGDKLHVVGLGTVNENRPAIKLSNGVVLAVYKPGVQGSFKYIDK